MALENLGQVLKYLSLGLTSTVAVTAIALFAGFVIGMPIAMLRIYGPRFAQRLALAYVVVLRGFPSLVVLFIVYFVIAGTIDMHPFLAGCVALGVCSSAYQAEIFRGAIQGVSPGQMMAARALGMSRVQAIWFIVLPQALRNAIPSWSNEASVVIKDSSLVYAVGVTELMQRANEINAILHEPLLVFGLAAIVYFFLTFATNRVLDWFEQRTRIPQMIEAR